MDLSVIIPARKEEWLNLTVQDVLTHSTADTEVIVVLDTAWPATPLPQHDRLTVLYEPQVVGQRAAYNLGARLSTSTYVAKLDAHCSVAPGWDTALIEAAKTLGPNTIQVPSQRNLHVYDWVCNACGWTCYQCGLRQCKACQSTDLRRDVVWEPKPGVNTWKWRFDSELHFQYWNKGPKTDFVETMSCLGACWFMRKDMHDAIGGLDEGHGSWGAVGTEIGCKAWLSGGRLVTNRKTWFAHFFRVGGQGFPYEIHHSEQEAARVYSRNLWRSNGWSGQIYPLRWLVDKFWPVPGWTEAARDVLPAGLPDRAPTVRRVEGVTHDAIAGSVVRAGGVSVGVPVGDRAVSSTDLRDGGGRDLVAHGRPVSKGLVYYSDGRGDARILEACREQIDRVRPGPAVAVILDPLAYIPPPWQVITQLSERGILTMFRQILAGLEALDAEVAFLVEHDVLYHSSHFDFTPPRDDRVYYNTNVYKVDSETGRALHYVCQQTSGLCANRELLVEHYRKRVARVERDGFSRGMGFEPGTHHRRERVDDLVSESWTSAVPNIDIRHAHNLTPSRWKKEQFKNQKYTEGWTEADAVPGWGVTRGRFQEFLAEVGRASLEAIA